jgi:hypothetical protein
VQHSDHWVSGTDPSSGILDSRKHMFRRAKLFPSSGEDKEHLLWTFPYKELTSVNP